MKAFIKKVILYLAIMTLLVGFLNLAYIKMSKTVTKETDKFSAIPTKIQICDFGASHSAYGFNYEDIDEKYRCFNFGLSSQSLSYDDRLFQYYEDHIEKETVVFIAVSYGSLFGLPETKQEAFALKNKRYYKILSSDFIKEYDVWLDFFMHYIPVLIAEPANIASILAGKNSDLDVNTRWQRDVIGMDLTAAAKITANNHIIDNKDVQGRRFRNQEEIDALYDLLERCKAKGAIPILITTPYLSEYTNEIKKDPTFYDEFYAIIDEVTSSTGVAYYDYAFDGRFVENYGWFQDPDHLNEEGARNFTNILMEEVIRKNGYDLAWQ